MSKERFVSTDVSHDTVGAAAAVDPGGDHAASAPTSLSLTGWRDVLVRTWREASSDNVGLAAAGVSYYAFLALLPLLAAMVLTYGIVADPKSVMEHMQQLAAAMPAEAAGFVGEQLMFVVTTAAGKKGLGLIVAIGLSLFSARAAAGAIITSLNIAYEEEERRSFIQVNMTSLAITASGVLVCVLGLLAAASIAYLQALLRSDSAFVILLLKVAGNTLSAASIAAIAATLYKFGPCRQRAKWKWVIPGAVLFAAIWVALTLGFGFYVANFGSYGATYGSLATVIVFLTWMYVAAYAFLLGAELNSELEHQTARDSTTGPEQPLGDRGAWSADHVA